MKYIRRPLSNHVFTQTLFFHVRRLAKLAVAACSCLVPRNGKAKVIITTLIKNAYLVAKAYDHYDARKQHAGPERGGENGYKTMHMAD